MKSDFCGRVDRVIMKARGVEEVEEVNK